MRRLTETFTPLAVILAGWLHRLLCGRYLSCLSSLRQAGGAEGSWFQNSSKPPFRDGSDFNSPANEKRKGNARMRGGQDGHPGDSRDLLPEERCAEGIPHFPSTCRGCGEALSGEDREPERQQVIEIPKIKPFVI